MFLPNPVEDSFVQDGDGEIIIESHEEVVGEGDLDSILSGLQESSHIVPLDPSFLKHQESNGTKSRKTKSKAGNSTFVFHSILVLSSMNIVCSFQVLRRKETGHLKMKLKNR